MKIKLIFWLCSCLLVTANSAESNTPSQAKHDQMIAKQNASQKKIAETINRCKKDFESKAVNDRLRAILVISKYTQSTVTPVLIKALKDSAAPVRQAALVAFSERPEIPSNAIEPIFNLFADSDIHIQRIATSTLPYLFNSRYSNRSTNRPIFSATPAHKAVIHSCFATEDSTVIKNILKNYSRLKMAISADDLIEALKHNSPEVRTLALPAASQKLSTKDFVSKVTPLMNQESAPKVIIEYLIRLRYIPRQKSTIVPKGWLRHKNSKIAATALQTAILQGNQDLKEEIGTVLESEDISTKLKVNILWGLRNTRYANQTTVNTLLKSEKVLLQAEGIKLLVNLDKQRQKLPQLLSYCKSTHTSVREEAIKQINFYYRPHISKAQVTTLAESEFTNIKLMVIQLLPMLNKEARDDFLLDYLIDGNDALQVLALRSIIQTHSDGWQGILIQSLKSDSSQVQRVALKNISLINSVNQKIKYLTEYTKRTNNQPQLQQYARRKIQLLTSRKKDVRSHK